MHDKIFTNEHIGSLMHDMLDTPGPSCSKLMRYLVNVLLKFQRLIFQICYYFFFFFFFFFGKNVRSFSHFSTKIISVFGYIVVIL